MVREVEATICSQCGEEWIDDATARQLEDIRQRRPRASVTGGSGRDEIKPAAQASSSDPANPFLRSAFFVLTSVCFAFLILPSDF